MTNPTPSSVTAVRFMAAAQGLIAVGLGGLIAVMTLAAFVSDRASAEAGQLNDFAGVAEYLGILLSGALVLTALLVGVPAALLRANRPGPRIALVVGELVTSLPIGILVLFGRGTDLPSLLLALGAGHVTLGGITVGLLLQGPAQQWCGDRGPSGAGMTTTRDLWV